MTTIAVPFPAVAPTPFERVLLGAAARLSALARERMLRRSAAAGREARQLAVADGQRDVASVARAGLLPR